MRPSALIGVEGWLGYQLDLAAAIGSAASKDEQRGLKLPAPDGYKSPFRVKKMKIPESGVW